MRALAGGWRRRTALVRRGAGRRRTLQKVPSARRGRGACACRRTAAAAGGCVGRRGRRRRRHLRRRTLTSGLPIQGQFFFVIGIYNKSNFLSMLPSAIHYNNVIGTFGRRFRASAARSVGRVAASSAPVGAGTGAAADGGAALPLAPPPASAGSAPSRVANIVSRSSTRPSCGMSVRIQVYRKKNKKKQIRRYQH